MTHTGAGYEHKTAPAKAQFGRARKACQANGRTMAIGFRRSTALTDVTDWRWPARNTRAAAGAVHSFE